MGQGAQLASEPFIRDIKPVKIPREEQLVLQRAVQLGLAAAALYGPHLPLAAEALRQQIKAGNAARNRLVESIIPWGVQIAKRYRNRGLDFDELMQIANWGLIKAVEKWDPQRGALTTVAFTWVRQTIQRQLHFGDLIRVPVHLQQKVNQFTQSKNRERYLEYAEQARHLCSLDQITDETGFSDVSLESRELTPLQIAILHEEAATASSERQTRVRMLHRSMTEKLSPRETLIVNQRLQGLKLWQIGEAMGICRERVRQIETRALHKLGVEKIHRLLAL